MQLQYLIVYAVVLLVLWGLYLRRQKRIQREHAEQLKTAVAAGLALGASLVLAQVMQVPFVFDPSINGLSFVFSAAIGVVFGYFPARRAARLDPIEALRHE